MPFRLFSERGKPSKEGLLYKYDPIPREFRIQVFNTLARAFGKNYFAPGPYSEASTPYELWRAMRNFLCEELGRFSLSKDSSSPPLEDCTRFFIGEADTAGALNFIDVAFRWVDTIARQLDRYEAHKAGVEMTADEAIEQLNERLDQHHLGYQFTGGELMRRDSQFVHKEITEPTAQLLTGSGFEGPNDEFLKAHRAYLKGDTKEAIREASNALESTLKTICKKRSWQFDPQKDTAAKLLAIVFQHGLVPDYLQSQFTSLRATLEGGVPTVRNRSAGHGQGPDPIEVPKFLAAYALHMTASAITFLVTAHLDLPLR